MAEIGIQRTADNAKIVTSQPGPSQKPDRRQSISALSRYSNWKELDRHCWEETWPEHLNYRI